VLIPVIIKVVSSPFTLLLLSPFLLLLVATSALALTVFLGHLLDAKRTTSRRGLYSAARPFAFSTPAAWQAVLTRSRWSYKSPPSFAPLYPESPAISSALNDILMMVVRDFVMIWYKELSSSPSFPAAVASLLHESIERLLDRASAIDISALIVKRILPKITAHIEQFRQSEVALRGARLERQLTQSEELDILLASRYSSQGGGKLHPAIDNLSTMFTKQTEENHLKHLIDKALPFILPEKEARSRALNIVAREIMACSVMYPVMDMVAEPDFWNRAIDQVVCQNLPRYNSLLSRIIIVRLEQRYTNSMFSFSLSWCRFSILPRKLITKVRNVLEAQSPRSHQRHSTAMPSSGPTETITIRTDARQFESFLRSINRCSSLLDARRLKNDIMGEIRRTRVLLGACNSILQFRAEVIILRQPITKMRIGSMAKRQKM
jgi:sorting nexin-25